MSRYLTITGVDSIVARDGRPFGDGTGSRMRGLPWPLPSAVAGSARRAFVVQEGTQDFRDAQGQDNQHLLEELRHIEVAGLFPVAKSATTEQNALYLPAPLNCLWDKQTDLIHRVLPIEIDSQCGCDLPHGALRPVMLTAEQASTGFKSETIPAWWPVEQLSQWLIGKFDQTRGAALFRDNQYFHSAQSATRDRLAIDSQTGAAQESKLFAVSDLTISHLSPFVTDSEGNFHSGHKDVNAGKSSRPIPVTLSLRVGMSDYTRQLDLLHPLGGNRRLAHWRRDDQAEPLWQCPNPVAQALGNAERVCCLLATPALFTHGWRPGWLDDSLSGSPPESPVRLKLVGLLNERWKALSRWALDRKSFGQRPLRRMMPAGSMFFFEVEQPRSAGQLAERWLQSVCDDEQDRRDGFGLAVWGTW